MELATIDMPVDAAQAAFEEYRAAVRERHDQEDGPTAASRPRLSFTWRCRLILLTAPVLFPAQVVTDLVFACLNGAREFGSSLNRDLADDVRWWYRYVYRPARYGSVHDA